MVEELPELKEAEKSHQVARIPLMSLRGPLIPELPPAEAPRRNLFRLFAQAFFWFSVCIALMVIGFALLELLEPPMGC